MWLKCQARHCMTRLHELPGPQWPFRSRLFHNGRGCTPCDGYSCDYWLLVDHQYRKVETRGMRYRPADPGNPTQGTYCRGQHLWIRKSRRCGSKCCCIFLYRCSKQVFLSVCCCSVPRFDHHRPRLYMLHPVKKTPGKCSHPCAELPSPRCPYDM